MYNFLISIIKKYFPNLYMFLKKIKNTFLFGKKFIKNKELETIDLIKSVEQESFFDFQKREFFKNKNKKVKQEY